MSGKSGEAARAGARPGAEAGGAHRPQGSRYPASGPGAPEAAEGSGRPRLSRRRLIRAAGLGASAALMAACASLQRPSPRQASGHVQLVYQDSRAGWFPPMVQQMLEEFHASHPSIRVFYTPEPEDPKDIEEKTLAAMQAGAAADVMSGCCSWFPIWAQKGHLLDLRSRVAADIDQATIDDWDRAQYRSFFTRDGRQYALPKYNGALALYYNRDVFDRYGVAYPDASWDHDTYLKAMQRLTHDLDGDGRTDLWGSMLYVTWDRIQMHVNGWGGHLIDPDDPGKCQMAEPPALAAMEWIRARMQDDRVMATTVDVQKLWPDDAFIGGRLAMLEDGSWRLKYILANARFRMGVAPLPAGPARRVTLATTDGYGIYKGTRQPDAAWDLLRFLTSPEFGRAMARANYLQPARASLVTEWASYVRADLPESARDVDVAAFADGHVKGYSVTGEVALNMAETTRITTAAWDQIFTLGQARVDLMKTVCREVEEAQRSG